jgi:hypothetical protein
MSLSGLVLLFITLNIYSNSFGLYLNTLDTKRIYIDERTTKHLFTYKYIPNNFDSVLIGPSLSDIEMDTKKLKGFKVYNLSLNSGNISELKILVENIIKTKKLKSIIICIDPYILKDSGKKTSKINDYEIYSSLGSMLNIKLYLYKLFYDLNLKYDIYSNSEYGYRKNDYGLSFKDEDVLKKEKKISIDKTAFLELINLLQKLRKQNTKIFAYYYPRYHLEFKNVIYKKQYDKFVKTIDKLFTDEDVVWDFNDEKYSYIFKKKSSYSDGVHLSKDGAKKILEVISSKLKENND